MKISNWKRLDWVTHYQHGNETHHPVPHKVQSGYERVELMTAGRGWVWHEGDWREVLPGDIIWNKPGDETIGRTDFEDHYRCLAITLITRNRKGAGMPRFSHWPDIEEVRAFTRESVRLFLDEDFDRRALFEYVVGRMLFRVRLDRHESGKRGLPAPLRAVIRKIEEDYSAPCRMEELARIAGWSVAHLHEVFRNTLETTPHQWLLRVRLRVARDRLSSTSQPVKQIAIESGFSDAAAFAHAFKALTGMTPGSYRERSRSTGGA